MRMAIETFDGISPDIDDSAFVAQSADVIGRVSIAVVVEVVVVEENCKTYHSEAQYEIPASSKSGLWAW